MRNFTSDIISSVRFEKKGEQVGRQKKAVIVQFPEELKVSDDASPESLM